VTQAERLFTGSRHDAKTVFAQMKKRRLPPFPLAGTVTMVARSKLEPVTSHNVAARLAAGDATAGALAQEYVVLTAHLDHLGIGAPVHGDAIYNGAQDNAVGIAQLLEAGRLLARDRAQLKRSILFVATTAEEAGLYGAEYFATHPTVPAAAMVANVNLDMPTHLAPTTDLVPIGVEHSTLAAVVSQALRDAGLTLTPDPWPEEVDFIRSDQYEFVRAGVPAVYLAAGIHRVDGKDGKAAMTEWMREHYHQPSDEVTQPIDWAGAARLALVNRNIAYAIATQEARPAWNAGDFFGDRFGRRTAP
jgi:Zn-dependent M28 family amino/carboxypeptidase